MDESPVTGLDCGPAGELFRVEIEQRASHAVLALAGQAGQEAAAPLCANARLLASSRPVASALPVLLALGASLAAQGCALPVAAGRPEIRCLLDISRVADRFPLLEQAP